MRNLLFALVFFSGIESATSEDNARPPVSAQASGSVSATKVTYNNKTSKLKAKTAQAAIDELNGKAKTALEGITNVAQAISGKKVAGLNSLATTTTWSGALYYLSAPSSGTEGPPATLQNAPVTIQFTPTNSRTGTLTITPVNFICEVPYEFDTNGTAVCGNYGDTFTYKYTVLGPNLFLENGRLSDGRLIGQGALSGAGAGHYVSIQNDGPTNLVLRYQDQVTTVFDLRKVE